MKDFLGQLAQATGMKHIDFEGDFWLDGKDFLQELIEHPEKQYFHSSGYIYGPFRNFFYQKVPNSIKNFEKYKVVTMLRDPRDVLTSLYFSMGYSHSIPENKKSEVLSQRAAALNTSIDNYVLENIFFQNLYHEYVQKCLPLPNVLLTRYEDMVNCFEKWLKDLLYFNEIEIDGKTLNNLINSTDFEVEENMYAHKRQVKPGDHRRKLKISTIRKLNQEYSQVLKRLGYVTDFTKEDLELSRILLSRAIQANSKKNQHK
jgi:hypothetical protein